MLSPSGNLFKYIFKSPCEDSEFKLYQVTFDLVKVYNLTLTVHLAVEEARARCLSCSLMHVASSCLERTIRLSGLAQHNCGALCHLLASRSSFRNCSILQTTLCCMVDGDMVRRTMGEIPSRMISQVHPHPLPPKCALSVRVLFPAERLVFLFPLPSSLHILTALA